MGNIVKFLKFGVKYGAYIIVFVDVISYAVARFEELENKNKEQENEPIKESR